MKPHSPTNVLNSGSLFLGAAWYPEQWERQVWDEDVRLMKELGMNVARVTEFAWSSLEPKEGKYTTGWLRDALDLLHANGLKAVIGTPTATPPGWLLKKHPEIGFVEQDGYRHRHGARQHACYNNPIFREHGRKITEVLAREFGNHPALIAWQTDNELRGHQKICICDACRASWAQWLKARYGSVNELNRKWGTQVWSEWYDSFEDVPPPYRVCCWSHHFGLVTDYRRFMSDSAVEFQDEHAKIIRAYSPHPVTHNSEDSLDEWDLFANLDFASADIYVGYISPMAARLRVDALRGFKPGVRYWTMETGSDSLSADRSNPGQTGTFGYLNYVSGSQAVLYWCWRQHRGGMEIQHVSLVYSNGQPTPGWDEVRRLSEARQKLEPILRDYAPAPAEVALIRSESNAHYLYNEGLEANFTYKDKLAEQFGTLLEIGAWRDVVYDQSPLEGYKVIFSPYLPYASPEFLEKMRKHLERGGTWVVGPYCGYREREHTVPTDFLFGQVEKMLGFKTKFFCPANDLDVAFADGSKGKTRMFSSVFVPAPGDEPLGTYSGGSFGGQPWGMVRTFGKGRVYIPGSDLDPAARAHFYTGILDREKVTRTVLPLPVTLAPQVTREGRKAWALSNTDQVPHDVSLPGPGRDLLTGRDVREKVTLPPVTNAFIAFE